MKTYCTYIMLLFTCLGFAQQDLNVKYKVYYNTDRPTTKDALLHIRPNEYVYIEGVNTEALVKLSKEDDNFLSVQSRGSVTYNQIDLKNDTITSKVNIKGSDYILEEKIPKMDWTITNKIKNIEGIISKEAILKFRGRSYTAWFTEEIPVSAGPWKFNGLPGLILEITDHTNRYTWQAISIEQNKEVNLLLPDCDDCNKIDLRTFCYLRYEKNNSQGSVLRNLPRGGSALYTPGPRNGIETLFEWEN